MQVKIKLIKACSILLMAVIVAGCSNKTENNDNNKNNSGNSLIEDTAGGNFFEEQKPEPGLDTRMPDKMPAFTAKDLDGNEVTDSIFKEKDLTVVNIWGTFCTPCVEEMPELGEWAKEMPDNVQIVGLICDIEGDDDETHKELAKKIMEKANAGFTQIIANNDFNSILDWVTGVPTTLFVDKEGNITGKPVIGAYVSVYKKFVEDYLDGK
jgi:Thiol-disulfide isomerase and thioredoxins